MSPEVYLQPSIFVQLRPDMIVKRLNPFRRRFAAKKAVAPPVVNSAANHRESKATNSQAKASITQQKSIAIIGSGVSGLTCAHYLVGAPNIASVTLFEANDYIGGHVNTLDVALADGRPSLTLKLSTKLIMKLSTKLATKLKDIGTQTKSAEVERDSIDTGFIVFNERTYPNFFRLLNELKVPFQVTDMSFSVKNPAINFEYNGHTLNTLLSQRRNIIKPKFWRFLRDVVRFNKHIKALRLQYETAQQSADDSAMQALSEQTLGGYLAGQHYGELFTNNYLLPMVSAIWSMGLEDAKQFPLVFFARFFDNHGLLDIVNRPRWFTIKGGSKQYVNKLLARFMAKGGNILVNAPVQQVRRHPSEDQQSDGKGVTVAYRHNDQLIETAFDEVIFACHADSALKLLADASDQEQRILSQFRFTANEAILHTDTDILPNNPLAWASWNYLLPTRMSADQQTKRGSKPSKPVLTYHMNILQRLNKRHNYLVSLNHEIDPQHVITRIDYQHPVFDHAMIKAQGQWQQISSQHHTHYCGAYWFSGFHEDGVVSGLRVCQSLGVDITIEKKVNKAHLASVEAAEDDFDLHQLPIKADRSNHRLSSRQIVQVSSNRPNL